MKGESIFMEVLYLDLLTTEDPKAKQAFFEATETFFLVKRKQDVLWKKLFNFIMIFNQMYKYIDDLFLVQVLSFSNWKDIWTRNIMKWSSFDL